MPVCGRNLPGWAGKKIPLSEGVEKYPVWVVEFARSG